MHIAVNKNVVFCLETMNSKLPESHREEFLTLGAQCNFQQAQRFMSAERYMKMIR